MANPPLGFSNNIVPATPLVAAVNAPRSRTPDEYDSDESMDDEAGSAAGSFDVSGVPGRSSGRSAAYRCVHVMHCWYCLCVRGGALLSAVLLFTVVRCVMGGGGLPVCQSALCHLVIL
jgi:hypothetical protein